MVIVFVAFPSLLFFFFSTLEYVIFPTIKIPVNEIYEASQDRTGNYTHYDSVPIA